MTGDAWDEAQAEIARLRAEVAALREASKRDAGTINLFRDQRDEARALLDRWVEHQESDEDRPVELQARFDNFSDDVRAFLARDEARRLTEPEKP